MRKILFRGKRTDDGEWVEGNLLYDVDSEQAQIFYFEYLYSECGLEREECAKIVDPSTVGQYTGLTDKYGKKIFDGDIVRTKKYGKIVGNSTVNDYDTFKVIYAPALFRIENTHRGFNLVGNGANYEVIGNIYDNPELLERSNGNA